MPEQPKPATVPLIGYVGEGQAVHFNQHGREHMARLLAMRPRPTLGVVGGSDPYPCKG